MQRDYSLGYGHVNCLPAIVSHYKEDIEPRHKRRTQSDILFEIFSLIISSHNRVHCSQNRASSIESSLDTSLGNRDSLLLHGLVDGDSVPVHHFVELINATDSVIGHH